MKPVTAFAGNLAKHVVTWHQITSDPWVLESVSGYHLEFEGDMIPIQSSLPNPPMLNQHEESVMNNKTPRGISVGCIGLRIASQGQDERQIEQSQQTGMISQEDWTNKFRYNFFKEVSEQEIIVTLTKATTLMAVLQAELTSFNSTLKRKCGHYLHMFVF